MWAGLITGLVGLAGVGLGTLLNWWVTLSVEQRREDRERERMDRITRRAKRLVGDELLTLGTHLLFVAMEGRGPSTPEKLSQYERFLPLEEWRRNKDLLAEMLDDEEWAPLPTLYDNIEAFRARLFNMSPGETFKREDLRRIADMATQAESRANQLAGKVDEPEPGTRWIDIDVE